MITKYGMSQILATDHQEEWRKLYEGLGRHHHCSNGLLCFIRGRKVK
jgi:hypothetical protein